jgi:cation diffusion facilitator family transporter
LPSDGEKKGSYENPTVVYGAIAANAAIAVTKFTAAVFTGSSAMLSEGFHSAVDTGNESLLLLGVHRSKKPPDKMHPFGYGKELYFWSLIVAIALFGVGGGMSAYEGITHLQHPTPLEDPTWNYIVLGIAAVFEMTSWVIAFKGIKDRVEPDETIWHALRTSKDPTVTTVLFEDSAALTGLLIAFFGILVSHQTQNVLFDGIASILIGVVLGCTAVFLAYQSRGLLIGESADRDVVDSIRELTEDDPAVASAQTPLTMHLGPHEILVNLDVKFKEGLKATQMLDATDRLERAIREKNSNVKRVFIEASALQERGEPLDSVRNSRGR